MSPWRQIRTRVLGHIQHPCIESCWQWHHHCKEDPPSLEDWTCPRGVKHVKCKLGISWKQTPQALWGSKPTTSCLLGPVLKLGVCGHTRASTLRLCLGYLQLYNRQKANAGRHDRMQEHFQNDWLQLQLRLWLGAFQPSLGHVRKACL